MSSWFPPPPLPELDDPTLIRVVDVVREVEIIGGLVVAALLIRSLLRLPESHAPVLQLRSYKVRVLALIVGLLLLALHAYERLGKAVVLGLFPIGPVFLVLCAYALHLGLTHPPRPSDIEERLAAFDPPKWHRPDSDEQPGSDDEERS